MEETVNTEKYVKLACDYLKLNVEAVRSKSRKRELCEARQLISYVLKLFTKLTDSKIADASNYKKVMHHQSGILSR